MTHWLLSFVMLFGLAAGLGQLGGDQLQLQDRDKLQDGSCSTCPCR